MSINGADLFGKGDANLSKACLKKASKKKKKIDQVVEDNLPFLVEWYFDGFFKGDQRRKYEDYLLQLLGSDVYFIQPLERLIEKASKKKSDIEIPKGLNVILMDNIDEVKMMYRKKIEEFSGKGDVKLSGDAKNRIETIRELSDELIRSTTEICKKLTKKQAKQLEKMGLEPVYASMLACTYVPPKFLNMRNIRRYVHRMNIAMYEIQRHGVVKELEGDGYTNNVGINLSNPDVIKKIYEFMLDGVSRKVFLNALVGIMLERNKTSKDEAHAPIVWCYDAITELILSVLGGEDIINYTGEKLSKKQMKKIYLDKKDLKLFMKTYSDDKQRDAVKNRDYPRRVAFSSKNVEENYPKVAKAFRSCNHDFFDSMWDETDAEKRKNAEQERRDKQSVSERSRRNNNGNGDNRNNRNDRRNRR